jgi:hypothetical protein
VSERRLHWARRGVQGGGAPHGGSGAAPQNFFSHWDDIFLGPHDI